MKVNCSHANGGDARGLVGREVLYFAMAVFLSGLNMLEAGELRVSAAASLAPVFDKISILYERETGNRLVMNLGASGTLANQIQRGAPADVFISADARRMDGLDAQGLLLEGTRQVLLRNELVIVTPAQGGEDIHVPEDLLEKSFGEIAVGAPDIVPAGDYAKRFLEKLKLWDALGSKLVPMANVRAVLATVESGNAHAGFVYRSDAKIGGKVKVAYAVPESAGVSVEYPIAAIQAGEQRELAESFIGYLKRGKIGRLFEEYGFKPEAGADG